MALLGKTLTVYVAADTSKLKKGLSDADQGFTVFGKSLNSLVGPALIGATAAAGAFAVKLGVDGVQAAMQEEAELAKLSTTLNNLGFGNQTEQVNAFIDELQYASATADSVLRPSFDRLVRSTGSVTEAQSALQIALDVAAGTGKSLEAVSAALGKAYDGNTGALSKLGAGIDAATLKSGDMNAINEKLTATFKGQSDAAADTASGGMKKLQIAADELIEAFGTGLVGAADASSQAIDDAVQTMRDLQPAAQNVGEEVASTGQAWLKAADYFLLAVDAASSSKWGLATTLIFGSGDALEQAGKEARGLGKQFEYVQYAAYQAAATMNEAFAFGGAETGGTPTTAYNGINSMNNMLARMQDRLKKTKEAAGGTGGGGGGGLTGAIEKMNPRLREQIDLVKQLTYQLDKAGSELENARQEMTDWIDSMAGQITSGIDLGAAYSAAFDEEGKSTGQSLIEGFNKQIQQAGIFGDYLKRLNSEGGPELRDAVAALGPEAGNKLAEQIIKDGLIPSMQSQLVAVKQQARTTAEAMTPEFLIAGVNSAVNFLIGTQNALGAATSQLEEMGRAMGKTIGDAAAEEIRAALAAAGVAMSGGNATLGGVNGPAMSAEAAARVAAGGGSFASALSSTSIAQAIERAIFDSNQRLGRTGQAVLQ
jgi:hypothetical protein